MREDKMTHKDQSGLKRFMGYSVIYGERLRHLKRHGSLHLRGKGGIWYVFDYCKGSRIDELPKEDADRIRSFWRFMDGDRKYYAYFYMVLVRGLRQVLWITKQIGDFELVCVPKSDPKAKNPVAEVCSTIAVNERFVLARAIDGSDVLCRDVKMTPVHKGGRYSVKEIKDSLIMAKPLKCDKVILVDDMVFSGKSIAACKEILQENGAKKVYSLCIYGYKRKQ